MIVGIGVLLDTFLVRTVLLLALDPGRRFWWPGRLSVGGGAPDRTVDGSAEERAPERV
ncbi:hypothetical protein [Streptomyces niveus]|uniref:hypothetical protein n=1 Tax=Streptomyces niveus TaxID=193462 RepID=UPI00343316E2